MLKSVFAKYVITFMSLLLVSFLFLLVIVNSLFSKDTLQAERQDICGIGKACAGQISDLMEEGREEHLATLFSSENGQMAERLLRAVMTNFPDMTVYVTDARGDFIFSMGKSAEVSPAVGEMLLDESARSAADGSPAAAGEGNDSALPDEGAFLDSQAYGTSAETLAYARPITLSSGEVAGYVLVTSTAEARNSLMETTWRSVAVAGAWIMLAALVAIYLITERIISPLREISRASKKLMVGQFDVRVSVQGKDEVAELGRAFNQMASELENLDHMRNSFVANVSHDLRTPMTTIAGFVDGILEGVIPPEEQAHYLCVVSEEVHRLSRLVTALLDVSRLQAGDRKFDMKSFDVCEMGRRILLSFEQKIDKRHLDVEFLCDEDRMYVLADQDAIHQILYNICDNAVKFSREGGKLRMSFAYAYGEGFRHRKVTVTIYNEGQGIPDEDKPFIFERFYKSDKSRSLDKSGVGLGMYIAKTIIDAHHETIFVSGEYGHDCSFTFTLPRTDPPRSRGGQITEEVSHD